MAERERRKAEAFAKVWEARLRHEEAERLAEENRHRWTEKAAKERRVRAEDEARKRAEEEAAEQQEEETAAGRRKAVVEAPVLAPGHRAAGGRGRADGEGPPGPPWPSPRKPGLRWGLAVDEADQQTLLGFAEGSPTATVVYAPAA
ncbi:hypothetical protein [Streptomyces sp. NPDC057686]|uniref:hypothetical protein n=1 Tax=Streptomyces sp. NPDC057686 TaxID=3346212 RepID=UPI00369FA054